MRWLAPLLLLACAAADAMAPDWAAPQTAAWTATGGTIDATGHYTAGPISGSYTVSLSYGGRFTSASITITAPSTACTRTVNVATVSQLTGALGAAQPGDCIQMAAGTYTLPGSITQTRGGSQGKPVILRGQGSATTVNGSGGHAWYPKAPYLEYRNFRFTNSFWGFYCGGGPSGTGPGCPHAVFDSMEVDNTRQSAIALQHGSVATKVLRSFVHHTGRSSPQWGEGVYVGGYGLPTTDVQVIGNRFEQVTAEAVDISDGSDRTTVQGNTIDGAGAVFINGVVVSLIGVRGSGQILEDNSLSYGNPHGIVQWTGSGNSYRRNRIALHANTTYSAPVGIRRAGGTVSACTGNIVMDIPPGGTAYQGVTCQ